MSFFFLCPDDLSLFFFNQIIATYPQRIEKTGDNSHRFPHLRGKFSNLFHIVRKRFFLYAESEN